VGPPHGRESRDSSDSGLRVDPGILRAFLCRGKHGLSASFEGCCRGRWEGDEDRPPARGFAGAFL
jgi:hypothetical protein